MANPITLAVAAQVNREMLPDLCTLERSVRTDTATGGSIEDFQPVSTDLEELPCRVSQAGRATEGGANASARRQAEYLVSLDHRDMDASLVRQGDRFVVRSGEATERGDVAAWAMHLYVLGRDGPQTLDPFPTWFCTTTPQPGQSSES